MTDTVSDQLITVSGAQVPVSNHRHHKESDEQCSVSDSSQSNTVYNIIINQIIILE